LRVFPAALLGRIVTIPYYPLSPAMLSGIVKLKLEAVAGRLRASHGAVLGYDAEVLSHIAAAGRDPESGARMVDNIITNTILPALSREVLQRRLAGQEIRSASIVLRDGRMAFEVS
jgi:type VI secretion system protein VasG